MSTGVIDWQLAGSVARRVGGKGPTIGREGAQQAVEELRVGAATAVHVVRDITSLKADAAADAVRVVDRLREGARVAGRGEHDDEVPGPVERERPAAQRRRELGAAREVGGARQRGDGAEILGDALGLEQWDIGGAHLSVLSSARLPRKNRIFW